MNNASRIMDLTDKNITLKKQLKKQEQEIKRLWKRNKEVYKEVRDYAYIICLTSEEKIIARKIIEHLATYLLFNTPIRKSDKK